MILNLTPDEVKEVTGKRQRKLQASALINLGIPFKTRADGVILISRTAYQNAMGANIPTEEQPTLPNFKAI